MRSQQAGVCKLRAEASTEASPASVLVSVSLPPDPWEIECMWFMPPSLRFSVTEALPNQYAPWKQIHSSVQRKNSSQEGCQPSRCDAVQTSDGFTQAFQPGVPEAESFTGPAKPGTAVLTPVSVRTGPHQIFICDSTTWSWKLNPFVNIKHHPHTARNSLTARLPGMIFLNFFSWFFLIKRCWNHDGHHEECLHEINVYNYSLCSDPLDFYI